MLPLLSINVVPGMYFTGPDRILINNDGGFEPYLPSVPSLYTKLASLIVSH
ncbi:MAG: hypothetical protein JSW63_01325 [Ignavibacterium sp.]|nr:MAG: hypothetical protein JSW63_01325 [Ignavibacterium sp.]